MSSTDLSGAAIDLAKAEESPVEKSPSQTSVEELPGQILVDELPSQTPVVESPSQTPVENKVEVSKYSFRRQVWTHFEKNGLVSFPRPVRGRIPNFHGALEAAAKLVELEEFNNACYVKVNIDKPQENVRILTLEKGKKLLVPSQRGKEAILMSVETENTDKTTVKAAVSRRGMLELGKPIELGTDIKIDMIVLGSVAVSREGHRIGKGEGFGDLEFAVLAEIGAVTENTLIVTTVHDCQVFDTLPHELFAEHDVPVDVIVTPTEIIRVANRLPKPKGILWNILSDRKMKLMAVLQPLRDREIANGKECHLKEVDTDEETERAKRRLHKIIRYVKYPKKRFQKNSETEKTGEQVEVKTETTENKVKENKKRPIRRFNRRFKKDSKEASKDASDSNNLEITKKRAEKRNKKFAPIQFSLRIDNIASTTRVRDLKNALAERNVKPTDITWRGQRGFAFIHFAKPKKEPEQPMVMDDIVASLQDMKIANEGKEVTLHVEPAKPITPITRIETMNITAV